MAIAAPAAPPRVLASALTRYPVARKTAPSKIDEPSIATKGVQLVVAIVSFVKKTATAAAPKPVAVASAMIDRWPRNFPSSTWLRPIG